jgi:hypothetical protein
MMSQLQNDEYAALNRLLKDSDFDTILGWFKRSLDEVKDQLVGAQAEHFRVFQGQAQTLGDFLHIVQVEFPEGLRKSRDLENRKNTGDVDSGLGSLP